MDSKNETGKRDKSFWKSDSPLTSKRVSVMLSNPKFSNDLAKTVRQVRHDSHKGQVKARSFRANIDKTGTSE